MDPCQHETKCMIWRSFRCTRIVTSSLPPRRELGSRNDVSSILPKSNLLTLQSSFEDILASTCILFNCPIFCQSATWTSYYFFSLLSYHWPSPPSTMLPYRLLHAVNVALSRGADANGKNAYLQASFTRADLYLITSSARPTLLTRN